MSPIAISIRKAAQLLVDTPRRILVCDTCALLDIIRLPLRADNASKLNAVLSAVTAIRKLVNSKQVAIVCPPPVPDEWEKHAPTWLEKTKRYIEKSESDYLKILTSAAHQGTTMPCVTFPAQHIAQHLYDLSDQLISSSIILSKENAPSLRANDRATSNIAPASKGAIQDCLIYEHMLEFFDVLPNDSSPPARVLLTSNTADFCDSTSRPKSPMDKELTDRSIRLCTQWAWAHHELQQNNPNPNADQTTS